MNILFKNINNNHMLNSITIIYSCLNYIALYLSIYYFLFQNIQIITVNVKINFNDYFFFKT